MVGAAYETVILVIAECILAIAGVRFFSEGKNWFCLMTAAGLMLLCTRTGLWGFISVGVLLVGAVAVLRRRHSGTGGSIGSGGSGDRRNVFTDISGIAKYFMNGVPAVSRDTVEHDLRRVLMTLYVSDARSDGWLRAADLYVRLLECYLGAYDELPDDLVPYFVIDRIERYGLQE